MRSLERELNDLREALDEERGRNVLEDPDVTEAFAQMRRDHEQDRVRIVGFVLSFQDNCSSMRSNAQIQYSENYLIFNNYNIVM